MTAPPEPASASPLDSTRRAQALRVLALSPVDALARLAAPIVADHAFEMLRSPEAGLMMVRARLANTGDRYNLGEVTVTRCVVRLAPAPGQAALAGVGHVMGVNPPHALLVAQMDALLQVDALHALLWKGVIEPLQAALEQKQQRERAATETSRVRFFTLQAEAA
ncbi:MAG: phosphonate C-P lyase system protein PhnG [Burkholderiales bacterium]